MNSKVALGVIIVILCVLGAVLFVLFSSRKEAQPISPAPAGSTGLGADLYEKVVPNPGANIPDTNPFEGTVNPLEKAYKNPFE